MIFQFPSSPVFAHSLSLTSQKCSHFESPSARPEDFSAIQLWSLWIVQSGRSPLVSPGDLFSGGDPCPKQSLLDLWSVLTLPLSGATLIPLIIGNTPPYPYNDTLGNLGNCCHHNGKWSEISAIQALFILWSQPSLCQSCSTYGIILLHTKCHTLNTFDSKSTFDQADH